MLALALLSCLSAASAKVIQVQVGATGLKFVPDSVTAAMGDMINFVISPSHVVAQNSFDSPCMPSGADAIYSGQNAHNFVVTINSTDPLYFYCATPGHCSSGMVMGVNPSSSQTVEMLISKAMNAGEGKAPAAIGGGVVNGMAGGSASSMSASMAASSSMASTSMASASMTSASMASASMMSASMASSMGSATSAAASSMTSAAAAPGAPGAPGFVLAGFSGLLAIVNML